MPIPNRHPTGPSYRPDIDGLRALAVASVLLGHAKIPGFSGGFVGVDVFYVISGFLITRLIASEIAAGTFSLTGFWLRRARRLVPALLVVLAFTAAVSLIMLFPPDLVSFAKSLAAQAVFSSNLVFWQESGYFDAPAELKPLLHTWSLAIEEQFYLLFPLLLVVLAKWTERSRRLVLALVGLVSLIGYFGVAPHFPGAAFYLLPMRAWELLLGAILAHSAGTAARAPAEAAGWAGLSLIGAAVTCLPLEPASNQMATTAACVGTAMLIWSGRGCSTSAARLLSLRPVVFIGLISYSLYLWHWPLLAFARYYFEGETPRLPMPVAITCLGASLLLAWISWRYVEQPVRQRRVLASTAALVRTAMLGGGVACAWALCIVAGDGFPRRVDGSYARQFVVEQRGWTQKQLDCHNRLQHAQFNLPPCPLGPHAGSGAPAFLLWGDSHAAAMNPAFDHLARERHLRGLQISVDACPPLQGADLVPQRSCRASNERVLEMIATQGIKTVVLVARWIAYASAGPPLSEARFVVDGIPVSSKPQSLDLLAQGLDRTIDRLQRAGVEVWILRGTPEQHRGGAYARAALGAGYAPLSPLPVDRHLAFQSVLNTLFDRLARRGVRVVDPAAALCGENGCRQAKDGYSLYRDGNHLSYIGALELRALLEPVFDEIEATHREPTAGGR